MSGLKWSAKWIGFGQHPSQDLGVFRFRRTFVASGPLQVNVSADQRYQLFVNGQFVGDGPQRGDLQFWHYDTYDLEPFLSSGENVLEALVWSFGRYAPMAQHTHRLAFVLEGDGVSTPDGWEVARVPGHDFEMMHNEVGGFYIDIGPGEIIKVPSSPLEWKKPNVVVHVLERGEFAGDSPWFMVPRSIPAMKRELFMESPLLVNRETNERHAISTLMIHPGEKVLLDFSELIAAYPTFWFEGSAGATIKVTYGEGLFDKDRNKNDRNDVRDKHILGYQDKFVVGNRLTPPPTPSSSPTSRDEEGAFRTLWWRTWRYLQIESDQPVRLSKIEAVKTGYPYEVESSFTADDPWVEKIWDVGLRTAMLCAGETYFDCPYYEQLQYVGDTRIQTLIHYYLSRDRRLARNAVTQFERSIMPNGLTQSRYPSRVQQIIPPFSLWWVMMSFDQMVYDRRRNGSENPGHLHDKCAAVCQGILDIWSSAEPDHWCFMDWVDGWPMGVPHGGPNDVSIQELYKLAFIALRYIQNRSAEPSTLTKFDRESLERYIGSTASSKPSEHAEALRRLRIAFAGGKPEPWSVLQDADKCTYYFQYYKHLAMQPDDYMSELEPWKDMIRNGLTTFAEAPEPTRSDCHAWSAHPLLGFFQLIAGVTSTSPGWKHARIAPKPGKLKHFEARIAHPDGDLTVKWDSGHFEIDSPVAYEFVWDDKTQIMKAGRMKF